MRVDDLDGALLDFWVAKVLMATLGDRSPIYRVTLTPGSCCINNLNPYTPSKSWAQGGPIIERERIMFHEVDNAGDLGMDGNIRASVSRGAAPTTFMQYGPTHLIAAMRCYVMSQFGEELPDQRLGVSEGA
jgi:hypothetical protein